MGDYHIVIFFSAEDGGYIADIPTLKFCSAFGKTPEKALAEVLVAKKAWLEAAKQEGKPIPKPHYVPDLYRSDPCQKPAIRVKKIANQAGVHNLWRNQGQAKNPDKGHSQGNGRPNRRAQKAR
jgi:predicted RNase H-like HicB family nuclease